MATKQKAVLGAALFYLGATAVALFVLLPFFWMISTSLKARGALLIVPIQWIPEKPSFEAYRQIFQVFPFGRAIFNSIFVAVATTVITIFSASMAAYVFGKLKFHFRDLLFFLILATMMIPREVLIIPLFLVLKYLGLLNTYLGLLAPSLFSAFAIFMLRQHIKTIPDDFLDAAVIDGSSHFRIYLHVILPLSASFLATVAVLIFMGAWNDYFWPLVVLSEEAKMTLNVALSKINGQYSTQYNTLMAGSLLSMLPIIFFFIVAQKYFSQGLQIGGLKS